MTRISIIGAGRGGSALLRLFKDKPSIKIISIYDKKQGAVGLRIARSMGIPVAESLATLLEKRCDIIINVTGSSRVEREVMAHRRKGIEIINGQSAKLSWLLINAEQKNQQKAEEMLSAYQKLYKLNLQLSNTDNLSKLYSTVVDYATELTHSPAGSLAIFKEETGEMAMAASKGFSNHFSRTYIWQVRKGGLTSHILNQREPLLVDNLRKYPMYDNPVLLAEKIRSLGAMTLWNEGKIMGILYINDYKIRRYSEKEISILSLISTLAAASMARAKMLESTRLIAITDDLTGLYNHRHLVQQLSVEIARTQRYSRPLALVMLDIDHFKQYNDTHGHLKGNDVLRKIGEIIRQNIRQTDIAARYGGEEFSVIMPETSALTGKTIAERLRKQIESYPFKGKGSQSNGRITASFGIAAYPENAASTHELINETDRALYQAKEAGRNQTCLSTTQVKKTAPPALSLKSKPLRKKGRRINLS